MRTAVERNHARVVDLLHLDDDVAGRLKYPVNAHIRRKKIGDAIRDAAVGEREILGIASSRRLRCGPRRAPLDGLRCQGRQAPVGRVLDQRGPPLEVADGHPVLAIGARRKDQPRSVPVEQRQVDRVAERRVGLRAEDLLGPHLHGRDLFLREQRLAGELRRPLERRGAVVFPGAL